MNMDNIASHKLIVISLKQAVLCFIRTRHHELSRDINMYKRLLIYQLILPYPFCVSYYCFLYKVATLVVKKLSVVSRQETGTSHAPFCLTVLYFYFNPLKIVSYFFIEYYLHIIIFIVLGFCTLI